jgi:hypothetical protein
MLANAALFGLTGTTREALELEARSSAAELKKSEFALKHAIAVTEWTSPTYILNGVRWLAGGEVSVPDPTLALAAGTSVTQAEGGHGA